MTCSQCGAANPAGHRFCGQCGAGLALACSECGANLTADQRFCGQCGTPLRAGAAAPRAAAPAPPPTSSAENRLVAVLFVDLVGFTALSETRDPEDVRELLSRYFETARTVIGRYGGVVEKFIGDAVMALWGAPATHEDDAERAVRAAMEVVEAVASFGEEVGVDLRARAGVVTGTVAAWSTPGEGLVAGDRVNTASRVQALAEAGQVLVDETTRRLTAAAIAYVDAGEHTVKGKTEPLHLYRAERVVAGVGGEQRVDGLEARFVGRDADLRLLKELFHSCVDRRSARLVSIVGVAGVGKSRLRWEFFKYIDGLVDLVMYHNGRCLSYGDGVSYWALAEMVRQRFGIAEEDSAECAAERLVVGLEGFVPDAAEREFLLPRLGALIGASEAPLGREELFAGWRLFFERLADQEPVIMAFEDMQWADAGLLDFIEHLLDWAADSQIFIVTFARPELSEARPGWPAGRRNATSLYLEPLSADAMSGLLNDLVADLPAPLCNRIIEQAEGIPLYAVETVRSLIDRDAVVPKDGVYRLVGDVGTLDVPSTLTSLIAARLDGLPQDERTLIKDLAVLGSSFPRAAVSSVSGAGDADLDRMLSDLVRREFLIVRSEKLSPDRGQYMFAQSLLRTVAYDMLSKRERKSRHLTVAAHLRATFENDGEDVAEVVAAHYRDALLAAEADADADDIRREAIAVYDRAGRRAEAVGAPDRACALYRVVADIATERPERLAFRERAAEAARVAGRSQEAYELFSALRREYLEDEGRSRNWARLVSGEARSLARLGRQEEAIEVYRESIEVLDDGTYSADLATATAGIAHTMVLAGHPAEAAEWVDKALFLAQALDLPADLSRALTTRATALSLLDRRSESLIHVDAAIEIARRLNLSDVGQLALTIGADIAMTSDRPDAIDYARAAFAEAQRRGDRYSETIAMSNLLYVLTHTDGWDEADRLLSEFLDHASSDTPSIEYLRQRRATLSCWRGDVKSAAAAVEGMQSLRGGSSMDDMCTLAATEAMLANAQARYGDVANLAAEVLNRVGSQIGVCHETHRLAWVEAVEAAFGTGDTEAAAALVRRVSERPRGLVPPYLHAEVARFQARLAAQHGDAETAQRRFMDAMNGFNEIGNVYRVARTQLDHAEWLQRCGRVDEAAVFAVAAEPVFRRLKALPWADRALALLPAGLGSAEPVDDATVDVGGTLEVQEVAQPG